jgi:epoxyqueuosine reductase
MGTDELTQRIKAQARALGFDLVGVAPARQSQYASFYEGWLAQGYAGEMAYLARPDAIAKRRDLRLIMPQTRSVIVVALNYFQHRPVSDPCDGQIDRKRGRISRYAWGVDYHDIMWARLDQLAAFVEENAGQPVTHRRYVDTGPLLERELAARAGLGWFGKNTMLINPALGSWFFLGVLLLDLVLTYDEPFDVDYCGTCTRCIDACPTHCILPDRTLDASRCISYLTIEYKHPALPTALSPLLGDWIFGCDVCQEVCPWNRFSSPTHEVVFRPKPGMPALDLDEILELNDEEFLERFLDSPIKRAKGRGLRRNAAIALRNQSET